MSVQDKISKKFRGIQGGLFEKVSKADVGTALNDLIANGAALMCWADPFYPDPAIPEHVKRATLAGLEDGTSAHYTMPIGNMELKINSFVGSMNEDIEIDKEGRDILIGFNPKFLIDALKVIDDETIDIYLVNPKAPCFIRDEEETYTYLILPVNFNAAAN